MNKVNTAVYQERLSNYDLEGIDLDRLEICIRVMERVESENYAFDISNWCSHKKLTSKQLAELIYDQDTGELDKDFSMRRLHECGSTACFGGWLAVSPEFLALGGSRYAGGSPEFNGESGYYAITEFTKNDENQDAHNAIADIADYSGEAWIGELHVDNPTAKDVLDRLLIIRSEARKAQGVHVA